MCLDSFIPQSSISEWQKDKINHRLVGNLCLFLTQHVLNLKQLKRWDCCKFRFLYFDKLSTSTFVRNDGVCKNFCVFWLRRIFDLWFYFLLSRIEQILQIVSRQLKNRGSSTILLLIFRKVRENYGSDRKNCFNFTWK